MASRSPLNRIVTQHFDERYKRQHVSHFEPARTHYLGLKAQNSENQIFTFECLFLKKQYIILLCFKDLQVAKFLIMYAFTHTNIVFLFQVRTY